MYLVKVIVVDLDGTLCDSSHRDHFAQAKEWDQFHQAAKDDRPRSDVAFFLSVLCWWSVLDKILLVACTGRNERYRQTTLEWLIKHDLAVFDTILMRSDGDWRPDVEVKPAMLDKFLEDKSLFYDGRPDVAFILEDRDKVVEAWRNLGYCCWQVQATGW